MPNYTTSEKFTPNLQEENTLWQKGFRYVAGIDEVGRGSWAGPLVAAAVILPQSFAIPEIYGDSKQLKPLQRSKLSKIIRDVAISYSIAEISVNIINKFGVGKASQMAYRLAVRSLELKPDFILIDAFYIKHLNRKSQKAIIKGDQKSATIAAASIIAKVYRDSLMKKLSKIYPAYGFAKNKGYGTKLHQSTIKTSGLTKIHRSYNLNFLFA